MKRFRTGFEQEMQSQRFALTIYLRYYYSNYHSLFVVFDCFLRYWESGGEKVQQAVEYWNHVETGCEASEDVQTTTRTIWQSKPSYRKISSSIASMLSWPRTYFRVKREDISGIRWTLGSLPCSLSIFR